MKKPKFIKEIEKFEWKERAECWRWYIRVYWELDHEPMVELESLEIIVKELHKLEEENKKLKEKVSELEDVSKDYDLLSKDFIALGEENKKLKKYYDRDKEELMESCYSLAKENEKLKSDLSECECSMHFENDEVWYRKRECKKLNIKVASLEWEIKWLNYTIEKLREENQTLELWLDNKEKVNEGYRKEIKDHQLYEEKLEHRIIEFEELLHWE